MKLIRFCLLLVGFFSFAMGVFAQNEAATGTTRNGVGPNGRFYPVHDIRDDWQVYDEAYKTYVPYIVEQHGTTEAVSAFIDLESNRHYHILLRSEQDCYLFINAALKRKILAGNWLVMNIDSLYRRYRQPEIFLTLYGQAGATNKLAFIGYPKSSSQKVLRLSDDNLSVLPRQLSVYDDFFGLAFLLLLASHAFLFNFFHRPFLSFYSIRDLLAIRVREEPFLINKPLSRVTIAFTLNLSFVLGFLIMFIQNLNIDVFASRVLMLESRQLSSLIIDFFLVSGVGFVFMIGKYISLQAIGSLYRLENITNLHYFKILQSSSIFFSSIVLLLTALVFNVHSIHWIATYLLVPFIAFYVARLVLLFLVIRSAAPIKSLYLISYLCIVELVPLLIGVRFAL